MVSNNINLLITPSAKTIKATFVEIEASSEIIKKDIGALLVTLKDVNEIFEVVTNSSNFNSQLRSLNPISWSIPATAKLVIDIATKYLTQRTGFSFTDWTKFFSSVLTKFSNYVDGLDKLPEILKKYDGNAPDGDVAESKNDEAYVLQIKSETQTWKSYVEQIAKLSLALDSIMDAQRETETQINQNSRPFDNVTDDIQKIWGGLTDKADTITSDKASEVQKRLIKWFFSSISGVKGKTKEFTKQARELSPKLSDLENLLELEIAQLQAYASKIKKEEIAILGARVSATIIIPQLKNRIDSCRKEILDFNNYLENLNSERENQNISEQIYEILANEYKDALETTSNLLSKSLAEAELWKREGVVLLENAIQLANKELEIIRARKLSGQIKDMEEVKKKSKSLNDEIRRLEKAREVISSL
ncbi:MAG TPA: hypothetical protein DHW49_06865 [Anaerolineae bacterium]|nr:hypothetical protein [Anaerolineae bacterium]